MNLTFYLLIDVCKCCGRPKDSYKIGFTDSTTIPIATTAGICEILWWPEDHNIEFASELIEPLQNAIYDMDNNPEKYKKYMTGRFYDNIPIHTFRESVVDLLGYLRRYPDAQVGVIRY